MRTHPIRLSSLVLVSLLATITPAHAQDYGRMLGDLFKNKTLSSQDLSRVIRSVSEVTIGQVPKGAAAPQDATGKVVLYSTSWCGFCKQAVSHMQQKGIPFVERDVEHNATYKAEFSQLGGKGVPFLVFGQKTMQGASPQAIDQNYAEFQRALAANPATPAGTPVGTPTVLASGDTLVGKISGVKVYEQPSKSAPKLTQLTKTEEVIYMGEERDGLYLVATSKGEGWADKLLLKKP